MDQGPDKAVQPIMGRALRVLFVGFGVLLILYVVGGWFDSTTELRPSHDYVLYSCFEIAGLSGLISGGVAIRRSKGMVVSQRAALTAFTVMLDFLSVFLLSSRAAHIIEGLIDFPAGETGSFLVLLPISRVYQRHGKGRSWVIETYGAHFDIYEDDYKFMLTHRRVGDDARNPDRISSKGFFCAQVVFQQSGNAVRVMYAVGKLPHGT